MLRSVFGYSTFRPLQEDIVQTVLNNRDVFVLMPTGGGKSLCYQLPALLLDGMTIVVSPLIALMKDQVDALEQLGVAATYINSSLDSAEISRRQAAVARGEVKLLYVAPERFSAHGFMRLISSTGVALFAIDEAHCVSEWGHDFRPEYRELRQLRDHFPNAVFAALTATATPRVQADIRAQLGLEDAACFQGSFNRPNLYYEVRPKQDTYGQIEAYVRAHPDASGIIYCQSRASTEQVAQKLRNHGHRAAAYHGAMDGEDRRQVQEAFVRDDIQIVVATIAFGMGIDKPDVRFVLHHDMPKNLEGFYQESGRAGRDGDPADCILFYSYGDVARHMYFIDEKPTAELREAAIQQLKQMAAWAESPTCRRKALLAYFDESFPGQPDPCCDVCRNPTEMVDYTVAAQMLLSCMKRTEERFGLAYVIDVLRGSQNERIQRFGHHRLSTWGIGKGCSKEEWQYLGRALTRDGYIRTATEAYNAAKITNAGNRVLFKGEQIHLPAPNLSSRSGRKDRASGDNIDQPNPDLFELLRRLRKQLADDRRVPPYVVFPDTTLRHMAASLPANHAELLRIIGVGEKKAHEYGDAFISAIASYTNRTDARPAELPPRERPVRRVEDLSASTRLTIDLFQKGSSIGEIAEDRGMAASTIEAHMVEALESGQQLDIDRLIDPGKREAIEAAIQRVGDELMRPIMDEVGDGYTWSEIRFTRAWLRTSNH